MCACVRACVRVCVCVFVCVCICARMCLGQFQNICVYEKDLCFRPQPALKTYIHRSRALGQGGMCLGGGGVLLLVRAHVRISVCVFVCVYACVLGAVRKGCALLDKFCENLCVRHIHMHMFMYICTPICKCTCT